jgi:hypothetical protein
LRIACLLRQFRIVPLACFHHAFQDRLSAVRTVEITATAKMASKAIHGNLPSGKNVPRWRCVRDHHGLLLMLPQSGAFASSFSERCGMPAAWGLSVWVCPGFGASFGDLQGLIDSNVTDRKLDSAYKRLGGPPPGG